MYMTGHRRMVGKSAWGAAILASVAALSVLSRGYANPGAEATGLRAGDAAQLDADTVSFFVEQVRPILEDRCLRCHGGDKVNGGLSLADGASFFVGGDGGAAVDLGAHEASAFLTAISYTDIDLEMPPTGKMPAEEIEVLRQWVLSGAPWPGGEAGQLAEGDGAAAAHDGPMTIEEGRDAWAYSRVVRPDVPGAEVVTDPAWREHPIDAFIFARLAEEDLQPNPEADRRTLIRRATYDLTGLPPTPEEVEAFVADESDDAYGRLIDRLLASPHYGEKWARHWLDAVRYAETDGYERDGKKLNMWRYRDYVIRAFNEDKPYDRFIVEQLAGDELPDADGQSLIATGFMRLQVWDDEPTDRVQARADYIADIVDTTSSAFLGSTVGCARCHDHKKDPILQADYYRLYAFFNNLTEPARGNARRIAQDVPDPVSAEVEQRERERVARIAELRAFIAEVEDVLLATWDVDGEPTVLLPDSRRGNDAQRWHVAHEEHDGWSTQQYDDRGWPEYDAGFGMPGVPNSRIGTEWVTGKGDAIYLRRTFRVAQAPRHVYLTVHHDDDVQVYINGILVFEATGYITDYRRIQLPPDVVDALVVGSNTIAVRCEQDFGGQYIDVGVGTGVVDRAAVVVTALEAGGRETLGDERADAYLLAKEELARLETAPLIRPYPASVVAERGTQGPDEYIHNRGNANTHGDPVVPGYPAVLGGDNADFNPNPDTNTTGRRLALARWIASEDNPLTARVIANRLWQHHFGKGLVESSSDFGTLGTGCTHPDLLDYLASEMVARGWSLKQMHKLIMTSRSYRMSSVASGPGLSADSTNTLLWRYNMRRLTAEEVRDSILAVNGSLNRDLFGPEVYPPMPEEVLATASRPDEAWGRSTPEQADRRSIYIHVKRSLREPFLFAFDQAETDTPCPVRFETTVPTQSLIALNSAFMQTEAAVFAERLRREAGDDRAAQVRLALELILLRPPTDEEVAEHVAFIEAIQTRHDLDDATAMRMFCVICFNLNEFMYLD
ncbi:PSD1 and planctomycete cytochrome C domain-containing protein [Phycisphaeraceae bacterium D3-23]